MAHIYHVILESIANGFLDPVEDAELVTAMIQQAGMVEDDTRERASQAVNIRRREWTLDSFPLSRFPQEPAEPPAAPAAAPPAGSSPSPRGESCEGNKPGNAAACGL